MDNARMEVGLLIVDSKKISSIVQTFLFMNENSLEKLKIKFGKILKRQKLTFVAAYMGLLMSGNGTGDLNDANLK